MLNFKRESPRFFDLFRDAMDAKIKQLKEEYSVHVLSNSLLEMIPECPVNIME